MMKRDHYHSTPGERVKRWERNCKERNSKMQSPSSRNVTGQKFESITGLKDVTNIAEDIEDKTKLTSTEFSPILIKNFYSPSPKKYSQTHIGNSPTTAQNNRNASHLDTTTSTKHFPTTSKGSFIPLNNISAAVKRYPLNLSPINHCSPLRCSPAKRSKCDLSSYIESNEEICESDHENDESDFECTNESVINDSGIDFEDEYIVAASFSDEIIHALNKEFLMRSLCKINSHLESDDEKIKHIPTDVERSPSKLSTINHCSPLSSPTRQNECDLSSETESESEKETCESDLENDESDPDCTNESVISDSGIDFEDEYIVAASFSDEIKHALNKDFIEKSLSKINSHLESDDEKVINMDFPALRDGDKSFEFTGTYAQILEKIENMAAGSDHEE